MERRTTSLGPVRRATKASSVLIAQLATREPEVPTSVASALTRQTIQ